jgi:hypothetical protein
MVLEWREREHEEENAMDENNPPTIASLRDCGLLKYFRIPEHEGPSQTFRVPGPYVGPKSAGVSGGSPHTVLRH